jgi:hypothetical protein
MLNKSVKENNNVDAENLNEWSKVLLFKKYMLENTCSKLPSLDILDKFFDQPSFLKLIEFGTCKNLSGSYIQFHKSIENVKGCIFFQEPG